MRLIYCKSTENRCRKFQIYTCIMQADDKQKYVTKKAVFDEGKGHIEKIYVNYQLLHTLHADCVANCYEVEEGIAFPYVEGDSYLEKLVEDLSQDESIEHWKTVLNEWKQLLVGNTDNLTTFDNSDSFKNIFGDAESLIGDVALNITNFDCIAENIIIANDKLYFIDYEWVYDFPIPLDLCFFRILRQFCNNTDGRFRMEQLLIAAGITDRNKIQKYEQLVDNFDLYVSYDRELDMTYTGFKQPQISSQIEKGKMKYVFPKDEIASGSRIVLYGAGDVGMSFYRYIIENAEYQLVKWVDKRYMQYRECGYDVCAVQAIEEQEYDYILLAIYNKNVAKEIIDELKVIGVEEEKIIWIKPQHA